MPKMPRAIRAPLTMAVSRPLMALAFVRSWQRSLRSSHVVLPAPIEVPQHEMQGQLFDQRGADETAAAGDSAVFFASYGSTAPWPKRQIRYLRLSRYLTRPAAARISTTSTRKPIRPIPSIIQRIPSIMTRPFDPGSPGRAPVAGRIGSETRPRPPCSRSLRQAPAQENRGRTRRHQRDCRPVISS